MKPKDAYRTVRRAAERDPLLYSQCWEDPLLLDKLLRVDETDDVLSVASAGDNTFALMLRGPRSIVAVDRNTAQLALVELKLKAMLLLGYGEFIRFIGARPSDERALTYRRVIRPALGESARNYWDGRTGMIRSGVIHQGRFERYFALFRSAVLPLVHGEETVRRFLELADPGEQADFYRSVWNNRRWRMMFRFFFSRTLLGRVGRDSATFTHVERPDIAGELLRRAGRGLTAVPLRDNFFAEYILTGAYRDLETAHPYLREGNFHALRRAAPTVQLVEADLTWFLGSVEPGSFSKFNLSDIFEYMSRREFDACLRGIARAGRANGRMAYWSLFVPRVPSGDPEHSFSEITGFPGGPLPPDRTFFYEGCRAWTLRRATSDVPPCPVEPLEGTGP